MKHLLIVFAVISLTFFVGCGGDEPTPPPKPPTMNNPNDNQALNDLLMQTMRAKQSCTQDYSPMFIAIALSSRQAAGINPQILSQMQKPQGGNCSNDLMNMMMAFTTLQVPSGQPGVPPTPYANLPQSKQWLASQLAGIATRIGMGITQQTGVNVMNDPALRNQLLAFGAQIVQTQIIPRMGPASGPAQMGFSQYANGV